MEDWEIRITIYLVLLELLPIFLIFIAVRLIILVRKDRQRGLGKRSSEETEERAKNSLFMVYSDRNSDWWYSFLLYLSSLLAKSIRFFEIIGSILGLIIMAIVIIIVVILDWFFGD